MTLQELNALTQLIGRAPMTAAEVLWVQNLLSRLSQEITVKPTVSEDALEK